jgi:hypothetical protein
MGNLILPLHTAALEVSIETKEAEPGDIASLQVTMQGATELGNIAFDLEYEGIELELQHVLMGDIWEGNLFAMNPEIFPSHSGLLRFNGVLPQGFTGSGDLLRLTFSLSDSVRGGVPVRFMAVSAADIHLEDVEVVHQDGGFLIETEVSEQAQVPLPRSTQMLSNYPNPFNVGTYIPYQLSAPSKVEIGIYSVDGKRVRRFDLGERSAGYYVRGEAAYWDGRDDKGQLVASGIYVCRLKAGRLRFTQKLVMVK